MLLFFTSFFLFSAAIEQALIDAATRGHPQAQCELGVVYLRPQHQNYGAACHWLSRATHQGHDTAKMHLDRFFRQAEEQATKDRNPQVWLNIGKLYHVAQNTQQAALSFKRAAQENPSEAQNLLRQLYENITPGTQEDAWLKEMADTGNDVIAQLTIQRRSIPPPVEQPITAMKASIQPRNLKMRLAQLLFSGNEKISDYPWDTFLALMVHPKIGITVSQFLDYLWPKLSSSLTLVLAKSNVPLPSFVYEGYKLFLISSFLNCVRCLPLGKLGKKVEASIALFTTEDSPYHDILNANARAYLWHACLAGVFSQLALDTNQPYYMRTCAFFAAALGGLQPPWLMTQCYQKWPGIKSVYSVLFWAYCWQYTGFGYKELGFLLLMKLGSTWCSWVQPIHQIIVLLLLYANLDQVYMIASQR